MIAWRLVSARYAAGAFDGEGARRSGGRFNAPGTALVYCADSLALALFEVAVHLPSYRALFGRVAFSVEVPDALVDTLSEADLPGDWRSTPPSRSTQHLGDAWVASTDSLALRVPSVLLPHHTNLLLNPAHPAFTEVVIGEAETVPIDGRLVK